MPVRPSSSRRDAFARPYVISWNLTYRCNLACEHCYLDAGGEARGRHAGLRRPERARHRGVLPGRRRDRRLRARRPADPDRRRAAAAPRHRRDHPLRAPRATSGSSSARTASRSPRTWPRILKREGVRGLSLSLDALDEARHDAFRRVTRRLAQHRRGRQDPRPRRAAVHRADDGRRAQRRRARGASPTSRTTSSAPGSGTSTSSCRPGAARTSPTSTRRRVRPRARRALGDPAPVRRPDAGQRQVRAALRRASCRRRTRPRRSSRATPAAPAAVRRARTTWASARTATSRRARTCRCSAATSSRRACGEHLADLGRSSSASASAPPSAAAAAPASSTPRAAAAAPAPTA